VYWAHIHGVNICRFYRIGLPIMAVHDLSDPFMEIAKAFNYCKAKVCLRVGTLTAKDRVLLTRARGRRTAWLNQVRGVPLADVFFVMFAIAFFVSRLIYYPRYLLWTIWYVDALRRLPAAAPPQLPQLICVMSCTMRTAVPHRAEATMECTFCMGVWFYLSLLLTLQAMHIYWMGLVRTCRRACRAASVSL